MDINQDFKEFAQLLNAEQVRYLVVGGFAVAFHGYPRFTGDIDFWVEPTVENAQKLIRVLDQFGFGEVGLTSEDFTNPGKVVQLGYPPYRIDIMTGADGIEFKDCWEQKQEHIFEDTKIHFISLHHLRINKQKTGRKKDLDDLEHI